MKLHEYQSKRIFAKYGIPIPKGKVASTQEEAKNIAKELGGRVVVKSQVLVGGRGKAGGIKLAENPAEAAKLANDSWVCRSKACRCARCWWMKRSILK